MNTIVGCECTIDAMFKTMEGWTTQFEVNGKLVGGGVPLTKDSRLLWQIETIGGVKDKRILELGPLEGAHTKMMVEAGAKEVIAIEGLSNCFLKCLIVKEAFQLTQAKFLFGDFCNYANEYSGEKFDVISAAGVLYHQLNPAELIFDLARLTDTVFVWSQVASEDHPTHVESFISYQSDMYRYQGKWNYYGATRLTVDGYCGGLNNTAFWMYPREMKRCFRDAGFENIIEKPQEPTSNGDCVLFIAKK